MHLRRLGRPELRQLLKNVFSSWGGKALLPILLFLCIRLCSIWSSFDQKCENLIGASTALKHCLAYCIKTPTAWYAYSRGAGTLSARFLLKDFRRSVPELNIDSSRFIRVVFGDMLLLVDCCKEFVYDEREVTHPVKCYNSKIVITSTACTLEVVFIVSRLIRLIDDDFQLRSDREPRVGWHLRTKCGTLLTQTHNWISVLCALSQFACELVIAWTYTKSSDAFKSKNLSLKAWVSWLINTVLVCLSSTAVISE